MQGVSIIVCCHESSKRLPQTLKHLSEQKISQNISLEIIVVDNASPDDTGEIATQIWNSFGSNIKFKVVHEPELGLIKARIKGVKEALYEYIIFCDDDNWLDKNYAQTVFEIMEYNPKIGALGGQSEAISDIKFPEWFDDYKSGYAVGIQAEQSGDVSSRMYLWGAGLVTRKSLMKKVFDPKFPMLLSGRSGGRLLAGDDSEICARILLLGYSLYYSEKLFFKHYIPSNRLNWKYKKEMHEGFEISYQILILYFDFLKYLNTKKKEKLKIFLLSICRWLVFNDKEKIKYIGFTTGYRFFFEKESLYNIYEYYSYNKKNKMLL
jgi:glycosyltransferase involved in cell wall biosynthesis